MKYIIAILLILFASYADIFLFRVGISPVEPSLFFIPLFFILCVINYSVLDLWDLFKSHSLKFFVIVLFFSVVYAPLSPNNVEPIKTNILLNVITILLYIYALHFFRTENKKLVFFIMLSAFIFLGGSVVYDFFIGLPKYSVKLAEAVRKGGFGENPNQAASAIKFLALGILVFLQEQKRIRIIIIGAMVVCVFLTMSRSGIISVILILIFGTANSWNSKYKLKAPQLFKSFFKMIFLFITLYLALVFLSGVIKENFPAFTRGAAGERLDLLVGKSDKGVISEDIGTSGGRGDLFLKYLNKFKENPFGYGTEYTGTRHLNELNTHNYYLFLAVNYGFLALIAYAIYLWYGLKLSIKKEEFFYVIFLILILFEGFISHSVYYERGLLICLAFFDSLIYRRDSEKIVL